MLSAVIGVVIFLGRLIATKLRMVPYRQESKVYSAPAICALQKQLGRWAWLLGWLGSIGGSTAVAQMTVLQPPEFRHYIERFNANDAELIVNHIPNSQAWDWLVDNVPFLDCPSGTIEEIYYFRWWSFRKHIKQTPDGLVLTEFLQPVTHAGKYNTVACAVGHHLAEARWVRDPNLVEQYARFWFYSGDGQSAPHFHRFSSWLPAALYDCFLVSGDPGLCIELLDRLVQDDQQWSQERQCDDGLFWQHDVQDGMEESISGGRRARNQRPTINSYMAANALAISKIAELAGRSALAATYRVEAQKRRELLIHNLWDSQASFFKVRLEDGRFSDVREELGFIPWMFDLADPSHHRAWEQLNDRSGFWAPAGITTAERRHPNFRTHGVGTCEWDGAVWPFATSQTLNGLANLLRGPTQGVMSRQDYLEHLLTYAKSHELDGLPYIGEYHDEISGDWLITGPKAERSRYYNHSTFGDLVIHGLVGLVPHADQTIEIDPLIPSDAWDWFCLDSIHYHGHNLSIVWDKTGTRYGQGQGLIVFVDGRERARQATLQRLLVELP